MFAQAGKDIKIRAESPIERNQDEEKTRRRS